MLTYEQYQKKKALLASGGDFSPEAVAKVQAALDEYENEFLAKGAAADEKPLAPGEPDRILSVGAQKPPVPTTTDALAQRLLQQLDPSQPLAPQVLALQPATTHPQGDEAAKDEWLRGDLSNPRGTTIVYDSPVAAARQDLLQNPGLFKAIGFDAPLTPESVLSIKQGDSVHQAYNDHKWREAANGAAAAGKTAYRYSKAPYLNQGQGAGILDTLSTKLKSAAQPYGEGVNAFVLGVDKGSNFGLGRAAQEAINPTVNEPTFGQDQKGGMPQGLDARTHNSITQEEHPNLYAGGQALGVLAPWSLANRLFGAVLGGAGMAAEALGGGALAQGAAEVGGAALGGAAVQGANEAVKAGSNYQQTGSAGTTLPEAASRAGDAAEIGAAFGGLGAVAQGLGGWVRDPNPNSYFKGEPFVVEKLNGGKVYPAVGHATPPAVTEARAASRARSIPVEPIDVFAEKMGAPLTEAAKGHVADIKREVGEATAVVKASPEGQALIPAQKTAETALSQLRERTSSNDGSPPTPVGTPTADRPVRGIFNTNIEGISVKPRKGWLPMKVSEAESFLNPVWRKRALRAADTPEPVMRPGVKSPPSDIAVVPEPGGLARPETGLTNTDPYARSSAVDDFEPTSQTTQAEWEKFARDEHDQRLRHQLWVRDNPEPSTADRIDGNIRDIMRYSDHFLEANPRFDPTAPDVRDLEGDAYLPTGGEIQKAAPEDIVQGARRPTPGELEGGPRVTAREVPTAREMPPPGQRWQRRTASGGVAPRESSADWRKNIEPGNFSDEMKARGIDTVYVAPRRYDAEHHESVIRQLRRAGGDTPNDRDLKAIYHAALEDRDARTIDGEPGAWSALQQKHGAMIRGAKETQKLAAPNEQSAYQNVIGIANAAPGQSKTLRALEDTSARAGGNTLEMLRGARVMAPLENLQARGRLGKGGGHRMALGPSALFDAAMLRGIYPTTRMLEGLNPMGGAMPFGAEQLSLIGPDNQMELARRRARDEALVPGYEQQTQATKAATPKVKRRPRRKD